MMKAAAAVVALPGWAAAQAAAVDTAALEGKWSLPEWIPLIGGLGTDGGGDSDECGPGDQAPPLSVPEDRLRWCCETKGVWCPLIAMPTTTTERPFDCRALKAEEAHQGTPAARSADDALKRLWCCQYEGVGCPKDDGEATTTSAPYDCHEGVADWQGSWPERKKRWCCAHGALGCEDDTEAAGGTTAPDAHREEEEQPADGGCDVQCTVKDFAAPCHEWVRLGVQQEFASEPDPCARARDLVSRECPQCESCDLSCTELAAPSPAPAPSEGDPADAADDGDPADGGSPATASGKHDCHGAGPSQDKSLWSEDKKAWCCEHHLVACFGCDVQCVVKGQSATCAERVAWSRDNLFDGRQDACSVAHDHVSEDCPVCSGCELGEVCPGPNATASGGEPIKSATDPQAEASAEATSTQAPGGAGTAAADAPAEATSTQALEEALADALGKALSQATSTQVPDGAEAASTTTSVEVTRPLLATTTRIRTTTRAPTTTAERTPAPTVSTTEPAPAPAEPEPEPYDCEVLGGNAEAIAQLWSPRRRVWCCKHHQQGCAKEEEEEPFDCTDGVLEWEHKWPFQKSQWCCAHYEVGCPDAFAAGRLFDSRSGQARGRPEGRASAIPRAAAVLLAAAVTCVALYAIARTTSIARLCWGAGADGGGRGGRSPALVGLAEVAPAPPPAGPAVRAECEALLEQPRAPALV